QPLYAKQEPRKFDRGTDLHTQSNPLPMCHRPGVLVKLTMA
ncbi:MAG TPA: major capsid protein, partial [Giesbergeria sp.]|nr:major capsid protein [Giesbergeria sp.]